MPKRTKSRTNSSNAQGRVLLGERVCLLMRQWALAKYGQPLGARGMQGKVALEIGLSIDKASHLLNDNRVGVAVETLRSIREHAGVAAEFFEVELPNPPDFRDYLVTGAKPLAASLPPELQPSMSAEERYLMLDDLGAREHEHALVEDVLSRYPDLPISPTILRAVMLGARAERRRLKLLETAVNQAAEEDLLRTASGPTLPPEPELDAAPARKPQLSKPARRH